jgi:hypothetical protein
MLRHAVLLLLALALVACNTNTTNGTDTGTVADGGVDGGGTADVGTDAGPPYPSYCENLSGVHCLLPWPSNRFLADDATTTTGHRLALPMEAMPRNVRGVPIDPTQLNRFDGFSPATSMMVAFQGGDLDPANLVDERHIADSVMDSSPTLLFEVTGTTLTRVEHFAEIDQVVGYDPNRRPLFLRSIERLRPGTRYIVAIRNLHHVGGAAVEPSPYFRALRDNMPLADAMDLEGRRAHFEEIFGLLTAAGVDRASLQIAWDFSTASDESIVGDMVSVRDQGIAAIDADGASCTVTMTEDAPNAHMFRRIQGTVRVPLFIGGTNPAVDAECRLTRDASGHVIRNATTPSADVPFELHIPNSVHDSVMAGGPPGRLMIYGHGLFGDRFESESGWLQEFADRYQIVVVAVDWWGMSTDDVARAAGSLGELSRFPTTSERLNQGVLNFLATVHSLVIAGGCQSLPELQVNGHLVYDPAERYYQGNSQGGIMGTTVAALSTDITHFGIGVGGATYSILIPRSIDGVSYMTLMRNNYNHDGLVASLNWVLSQSQWDLADPSSYASHIRGNTLPCALPTCTGGHTPAHHVLFQIGRDDAQVANVQAAWAARTMRDDMGGMLPLLSDATHLSPFVPYGLPTTSGDVESALVVYLIPGTPALPIGAVTPDADTPAHEGVRRSMDAQAQLDHFFHTDGTVIQTCDGPCGMR